MTITVKMFSCICSAQDEGLDAPPICWSCGRQMKQWGTREAKYFNQPLTGERADKRTENGGY